MLNQAEAKSSWDKGLGFFSEIFFQKVNIYKEGKIKESQEIYILRKEHYGQHFADYIFKCILLIKKRIVF